MVEKWNSLPVHQGIFQEWSDSIDVIFTHLTDVLEQERQGLEDAVLDIQLRDPVLVHQGREDREWWARLGHDGNRYSRADTVLAFLHFEIVQQRG